MDDGQKLALFPHMTSASFRFSRFLFGLKNLEAMHLLQLLEISALGE